MCMGNFPLKLWLVIIYLVFECRQCVICMSALCYPYPQAKLLFAKVFFNHSILQPKVILVIHTSIINHGQKTSNQPGRR